MEKNFIHNPAMPAGSLDCLSCGPGKKTASGFTSLKDAAKNYRLLFDRNFKPKPAFNALIAIKK